MKTLILTQLVNIILGLLTPELLKEFADKILDFAENYVLGTKSSIDDAIVLPLCQVIRKTFDIPDND